MDEIATGAPPLSPVKRALIEIRELKARLAAAEAARSEPIAIVGLGYDFLAAPMTRRASRNFCGPAAMRSAIFPAIDGPWTNSIQETLTPVAKYARAGVGSLTGWIF